MRTKLSILLLTLIHFHCYGQLEVDAGDDLIICVEDWYPEFPTLGGNPAASGGVEPYTYSWTTEYPFILYPLWASDFLNDTSLANPSLQSSIYDSLVFKLIVTDSIGNQAEDSIRLRFSSFRYTMMDCISFIKKGDTASLFANGTSFNEPLSYSWSPDYNISDITAPHPRAWPDSNFTYTVLVTDAYGCVASPTSCNIYVEPLSIIRQSNTEVQSSIYPNPIENSSLLEIENYRENTIRLQIFDSSGKLIFDDRISNHFQIGCLIRESGSYFYHLRKDKQLLSYGRFIKK